jgi:hypothetical protein
MAGIIPQNPVNVAQQQQLFRQLASLPADVRQFIGEQYAQSQVSILPLPYWSTVRFQATIAGAAATIDTTERRAFGYAQGQLPSVGGFPAAFGNATFAETNITTASQTVNNADLWIWGIAANVTPDSDPALAARVWRETYVSMAFSGSTLLPVGTLEMLPGAGGLRGCGQSALKRPALNTPGMIDGGAGASIGFFQNGQEAAGNFFRLPQPFKWSAIGSAGTDSSFVISCTPQRTITEVVGTARAAAAGTDEVFTPPTTGQVGSYVDVRFHLVCVSVARRGQNV